MYNANTILNSTLADILPLVENWLRTIIRDEVEKANEADRLNDKTERQFSTKEACDILHVCKTTLWKKVNEGEIKPIKVGRRVLYPESEINKLLDGKK